MKVLAAIVTAALLNFGCSTGTCPAVQSIHPGAACTDDSLQCPWDFAKPCDGVSETSCTCTGGAWVCPTCSPEAGADAPAG